METVTCKCKKQQCLFCKHSKVGDPCNKENKVFTKASLRDILDKAIIYKVKEEFLNEQIDKAKSKNAGEQASDEVKKMRKSLKETIKIKTLLDKEVETLKQELGIDTEDDLLFNIQTIRIKDIEQ